MNAFLSIAGISVTLRQDNSLTYLAGCQIDGDGSGGNAEHDPCFQNDTTLHDQGKALNARKVPFIVVPPVLRARPKGIVLGCKARITNVNTGQSVDCVVGDIGPADKLGEVSIAAAHAIGIPSSPISGGTHERIVRYEIWPGVPATFAGHTYKLVAA